MPRAPLSTQVCVFRLRSHRANAVSKRFIPFNWLHAWTLFFQPQRTCVTRAAFRWQGSFHLSTGRSQAAPLAAENGTRDAPRLPDLPMQKQILNVTCHDITPRRQETQRDPSPGPLTLLSFFPGSPERGCFVEGVFWDRLWGQWSQACSTRGRLPWQQTQVETLEIHALGWLCCDPSSAPKAATEGVGPLVDHVVVIIA